MADYTKYKRGSEWRKWDLHIHTPETKKNDQFEGISNEEKWEKYVAAINASQEEIAVIGITDYFCIDNYFNFKGLVANGTITKKFDLILPNIEIRVLPVTGSATPINLHCIFNPSIESDLENRFLAKLKFNYSGSDYSAKREELIRLGKALPGNSSLPNESALKAGIAQYVVSIDVLRSIFEKDQKLRENTIIVVSNKSTDGASGIRKHVDFFVSPGQSQLDATRWSIYQFSDAIFSSNESDVLYFTALGPDSKDSVIEKCGTLMPCFHGCDAHDNAKIFKPDQNRFCWIKADPTFEGLKQTLYEPADRVRIQALRPDIKNERFIISHLQYINSSNLFSSQKIYLNENLNAIIGGKSSGKSLLMFSAAKSIDPEQVNRASKRLGFEGYKFDTTFNFEVSWKNGEKDALVDSDLTHKLQKISYIPQLYINYLVEKNNKEDLNGLIKNILLQDTNFRVFFETTESAINEVTIEIEKLLSDYLQVRNKALEISKKSKELGKSASIQNGIQSIEVLIADGQKASTLNKTEFSEYNTLADKKSLIEADIKDFQGKNLVLERILNEVISSKKDLLGSKGEPFDFESKGKVDSILDELTSTTIDVITIRNKIEADYDILIANLRLEIANLKVGESIELCRKEVSAIDIKLKPLLNKIEGQTELQKLVYKLASERENLQKALNLEKQLKGLLTDYENIRKKTVVQLKRRYEFYVKIVEHINSSKNIIGPEILMNCRLLYKKENFILFDQANKASIPNNHYFESLFSEGLVNYDLITELYAKLLRVIEDKLIITPDLSIPLKQKISIEDVLRGLIKDAFELDYTVSYKGDDLLNMSPGKKGTVLLILFLQISSSEYPILIDQPEDNLDNRTIYELLCKMIKQKKRERQIIIVSHNANLVVATDTENIIVANQEGQGAALPAGTARFEYVNGSLEHSFPLNNASHGVLKQQGIKEHVCDILEGGDEAFKQRERKYSIK